MADLGRQLADLLYGSEPVEPQKPTYTPVELELLRRALGAGEAAATIGTGILGSVPAGLAGLASMIPTRGRRPDLNKAVQRIERVQDATTFMPRTQKGQEYLQNVGSALSVLGMPAELIGEKTLQYTGSPGLATAANVLLDPANLIGMPGSGKAVMAAGRGAARGLDRALGTLPTSPMAGAPTEQLGAIVFHGSPHKFAATERNPLGEFDPTKIGTGEGAQAYGHGLYLAEAPGVASDYKRKLSDTLNIKGDATDLEKRVAQMALTFGDNTSEGAVKWLSKYEGKGAEHTTPALTPEIIQSVKQKFHEGAFSPGGYLYKVDLPDEQIAKMLDWDKPLSEQPNVLKALKGTDYEVGMSQKEAEKIADQRLRQEAYDWADETGGDPVDYINNADWNKYVDQVRKESGKVDGNLTGKDLHQIIMRDEGYNPILFDSENYQIGTSETLRNLGIVGIKYLDRSSRKEGKGTRNFVVFPGEEKSLKIIERKKDGGSVRVSDNLDTMALELQVGGVGRRSATESAKKAAKKAAKEAEKTELKVPLSIPRAPAKTKEEIRPIAQRMAKQMTGEFVRAVEDGPSINPAGKSFSQFKREKEAERDFVTRATKEVAEPPYADIQKQMGLVKLGIPGDTTIANRELIQAGPYKLDIPSPQHGGPRFPLGGEGAWASNNPQAANVQRRAIDVSQYFDAPVLGQYIAMGPTGSNFAQHFADASLRAIDTSKMTKRQIESFNKLLREGSEKSGPRPTFPGIQDKDQAYLWLAFDPELRKHFNSLMVLPKHTQPLGLPDGRMILSAITEPELRNKEILTTGFSQFDLDPSVKPENLPLSMHPTYTHLIPMKEGALVRQTRYPTPSEIEFPDVTKFIRENYRPSEFVTTFQKASPRQLIDQQAIDEIRMFEELMKEYTGKKEGGAVKKQAGGAIKAAAKAAERAAKASISEADRLKFAELASSGKMHMAKSEQQEIDDLLKGASKFAELRLNWEDPKTYDMVSKLEKKGYKTQVFTGRPDAPTYIFKEPKDIKNVLRARTPYEFGKAYGYSDADIAKFYLQRRGGMEDVAAQDWLRDSQNSRLATPPSPEQAARLAALRERIAPQAELVKRIMNENLDKPLGEIEEGGLLKALKEMPKKRGGKVSITDNLDTMRLAVQKRK